MSGSGTIVELVQSAICGRWPTLSDGRSNVDSAPGSRHSCVLGYSLLQSQVLRGTNLSFLGRPNAVIPRKVIS
jgi:hypothetical protein